MKIPARIIKIDQDRSLIILRSADKNILGSLNEEAYVEVITDPDRKHKIRKKIFSLIGFLWNHRIYDVFGESLKDSMREVISKMELYRGLSYAKDMYRYNICLQCGFTRITMGLFPDDKGGFVRMYGTVARSMSDQSGITYDDLTDFYRELEYLTVFHCGDEFFKEWENEL